VSFGKVEILKERADGRVEEEIVDIKKEIDDEAKEEKYQKKEKQKKTSCKCLIF
jgi:hypothetical protein